MLMMTEHDVLPDAASTDWTAAVGTQPTSFASWNETREMAIDMVRLREVR